MATCKAMNRVVNRRCTITGDVLAVSHKSTHFRNADQLTNRHYFVNRPIFTGLHSCGCFAILVVLMAFAGDEVSNPFEGGNNPPESSGAHDAISPVPKTRRDWQAELESGYREGSDKPLTAFLEAWHTDSTPVAEDILKKKLPFEQQVYRIYVTFYRPDDVKYLLVQDEMSVIVVASDLREAFEMDRGSLGFDRTKNLTEVSRVVIKDFRPKLSVRNDQRVLYLQDKYLACFVGFITQHEDPFSLLRGNQYQWEQNALEDRPERLKFLNRGLHVLKGHWRTGWVFITEPRVSRIYLGSDMRRAIVFYRQHFWFAEALLERTEGYAWTVLSKESYAIE